MQYSSLEHSELIQATKNEDIANIIMRGVSPAPVKTADNDTVPNTNRPMAIGTYVAQQPFDLLCEEQRASLVSNDCCCRNNSCDDLVLPLCLPLTEALAKTSDFTVRNGSRRLSASNKSFVEYMCSSNSPCCGCNRNRGLDGRGSIKTSPVKDSLRRHAKQCTDGLVHNCSSGSDGLTKLVHSCHQKVVSGSAAACSGNSSSYGDSKRVRPKKKHWTRTGEVDGFYEWLKASWKTLLFLAFLLPCVLTKESKPDCPPGVTSSNSTVETSSINCSAAEDNGTASSSRTRGFPSVDGGSEPLREESSVMSTAERQATEPAYRADNSGLIDSQVDVAVVSAGSDGVSQHNGVCKGEHCSKSAALSGDGSAENKQRSVHMERIKMMMIPIVSVAVVAAVLVTTYCLCRYKKCLCCQRQLDKCNSICDQCMRGDFGGSPSSGVMIDENGEMEALEARSISPTTVSGDTAAGVNTRATLSSRPVNIARGSGKSHSAMYIFRQPSHSGSVASSRGNGVAPGRLSKSLQHVPSTSSHQRGVARGSRGSLQSASMAAALSVPPASRSDSIHRLLGGPPRTSASASRSTSFSGSTNKNQQSQQNRSQSAAGGGKSQSNVSTSRQSSVRSLSASTQGDNLEAPKGFLPPMRPY